jgi:hypothetical protein
MEARLPADKKPLPVIEPPNVGDIREKLAVALLFGLAFLYLAAAAGSYTWYAWTMAHYPYAIDYGEGHALQRVIGLLDGRSPYPDFGKAPYLVGNYPPLFDILVAIPTYFAGPQLLWGRSVSIFGALAAGALIAVFVYRKSGRRAPACLGGLMFFASHWLMVWSVVSRIDLVSVAFTLAGLLVFADEKFRRRNVMLLLSASLFAAAIYTRHSALAGPLAALVYLLLRYRSGLRHGDHDAAHADLRVFLRFGLMLTLVVAMPALVLQWLTNGNFLPHISTLTVGQFRLENLKNLWGSFATIHGASLFLAFVYVALSVWHRVPSLPAVFWGLVVGLTVSAANTGSYVNYFMEAWAATCLLCGLLLAKGFSCSRVVAEKRTISALLMLSLLFQFATFRKYADLTVPGPSYSTAGHALVEQIRQTPGDVLSEDTAFMALAGKRTVYQPFSMSKLVRTGKWDPQPILEDIGRQRFGLILMQENASTSDRWTPDVVAAVSKYYELRAIVPVFEVSVVRDYAKTLHVYVPKRPVVNGATGSPAGAAVAR